MNANQACDASEPLSAATGADGAYTLTYQPTDVAAASAFQAAAVLAVVGASAVDAADPNSTATTREYVLAAPAGKAAQISPLTTLVQNAVAKGLSLADAEAAVAQQLAVPVAKLYDYQGDPLSSAAVLPDTARTAAQVTATVFEWGGVATTVAVAAPAMPAATLASLNYTDAQNYTYAVRETDGVVDANGNVQQFERRAGLAAGTALTGAQLYPTPASVQLTDNGWNRCDGTPPRLNTRGSPSRTRFCDGATRFYSATLVEQDVSGRAMADVVAQMQVGDSRLNAEGVTRTPVVTMASTTALGTATFPAGSTLRTNVSAQLNWPIRINNTATDSLGNGTLANLVATRTVAAANPATAAGTLPLGLVDSTHSLRAAFIDGGTAQLYRCDATAPNYTDSSNCTPLAQSAFTIQVIGGVNVLKFTAFPTTTLDSTRGYAEYNGAVYQTRQQRPATDVNQVLSYAQRLNGTAWGALKAQLGLQ
ncbi:hypothetical protein ASF94_01785 [Acidovorax sp. Leaf160]|nr:hypothetical protein ASF94_01785 [Acidovorax sp. Leaf160]